MVVRVLELNFPSKCGIIHGERGNENETKARTFRKAILRTSAKWSDVIQENGKKNGRTAWLCKCDCGNYTTVQGTLLNKSRVISCGCLRDEEITIDITGKKFNHLTAICFDHVSEDKRYYWKFRRNCGNEIIARKIYVTRGELKSCGCISIVKEGSSEELEIKNYILSLNKNIKIEKTREILDGKEIKWYMQENAL